MMIEAGPRSLLRAIFPEKPRDTPIYNIMTQDDGVTRSLRDALNIALDTLVLTRGSNDSVSWPRLKTVLDQSHGLNGAKLTSRAIALRLGIDLRYVSQIRRAALRELRRNEEVMQRLRAFFHSDRQE